MLTEIALLVVAVALIFKGSEWVTDAAVPVATALNTTHIAVGLVLVSLLLSLPELMVALSATAKSYAPIGIGVSIGSIIVNLGLIIGISAMIHPLKVPRHVITRDAVFMLVVTIVVALIVLEDMQLSRRDGLVFLLLFLPYLVNVYEQEKALALKERKKESMMIAKTLEFTGKIGGAGFVIKNGWVIFIAGIAALLVGAELFTNSLVSIVTVLQLPAIFIGLTIGALGTSIPNLAAALQAVRKGYDELALSETIGSNIFTLLITLGVVAVITPTAIDSSIATVTAPALVVVTAVFFAFTLTGKIGRWAGFVLFALYVLTVIAEFMFRV